MHLSQVLLANLFQISSNCNNNGQIQCYHLLTLGHDKDKYTHMRVTAMPTTM